jgi:NAD(P)-dependent dehydrogenase (short-subunit alcohol dehydrogenase family)
MGWLDGQVALVTGGGSGIGQAIVTRFIQEGARVGVMDRVTARVDKLQTDFGKLVVPIGGDVVRLDDNKRAVATTVDAFGRLDIFVGNAACSTVPFPSPTFPKTNFQQPATSCSA